MSNITFTKTIGLFQKFCYKKNIVDPWEIKKDNLGMCFISVFLVEITNEKNEFVRNALRFETETPYGHTICKQISDDKEAYDAQFNNEGPMKKFYVGFEGKEPYYYVAKIYDITEREDFKEFLTPSAKKAKAWGGETFYCTGSSYEKMSVRRRPVCGKCVNKTQAVIDRTL